jgi:hypothetical protein
MAHPGRIVVEIGKALGKAVIAGVGLELARIATRAVRSRIGVDRKNDNDDDDRAVDAHQGSTARERSRSADDILALRRENASLRAELDELRRRRDDTGT